MRTRWRSGFSRKSRPVPKSGYARPLCLICFAMPAAPPGSGRNSMLTCGGAGGARALARIASRSSRRGATRDRRRPRAATSHAGAAGRPGHQVRDDLRAAPGAAAIPPGPAAGLRATAGRSRRVRRGPPVRGDRARSHDRAIAAVAGSPS